MIIKEGEGVGTMMAMEKIIRWRDRGRGHDDRCWGSSVERN